MMHAAIKGHERVVDLLLQHGADADLQKSDRMPGATPDTPCRVHRLVVRGAEQTHESVIRNELRALRTTQRASLLPGTTVLIWLAHQCWHRLTP